MKKKAFIPKLQTRGEGRRQRIHRMTFNSILLRHSVLYKCLWVRVVSYFFLCIYFMKYNACECMYNKKYETHAWAASGCIHFRVCARVCVCMKVYADIQICIYEAYECLKIELYWDINNSSRSCIRCVVCKDIRKQQKKGTKEGEKERQREYCTNERNKYH